MRMVYAYKVETIAIWIFFKRYIEHLRSLLNHGPFWQQVYIQHLQWKSIDAGLPWSCVICGSKLTEDAVVGTPDYSHFVTWLNLAECTWTIDRVFLNDVLPAGSGYGAKAICEHLLAPPDLFFHTASSTLSQLGSFLESLPDLKKIASELQIRWCTAWERE